MGLCPFHGEKSPSFSVSASKQFYYCFGCGASGDAMRFLTEHNGMGFVDAVHELAQAAGMQVPEGEFDAAAHQRAAETRTRQASLSEVLDRAAEHYRQHLKGHRPAVDYLKRRGLSGEIAQRFGLGYAPAGWRSLASAFSRYDDPLLVDAGMVIVQGEDGDAEQKRYDRFRDRIMFPIRSVKGEVHRIRRAGARRRRAQIPELAGDAAVRQGPRTLRLVRSAQRHAQRRLCAGRRRLHGRGGAGPDGLRQRRGHAGHRLHGRTPAASCSASPTRWCSASTATRPGSGPRPARSKPRCRTRPTCARCASCSCPVEHDPDSYVREHGAAAFAAAVKSAVPLSTQFVRQAGAECDLSTPEGRARLLAAARPLWSTLPADGMLRRQLLGEHRSSCAVAGRGTGRAVGRGAGVALAARRERGRLAGAGHERQAHQATTCRPGGPGRAHVAAAQRLVGATGQRRP